MHHALQLQSFLGSSRRIILFRIYRQKKVMGGPNAVGRVRNFVLFIINDCGFASHLVGIQVDISFDPKYFCNHLLRYRR